MSSNTLSIGSHIAVTMPLRISFSRVQAATGRVPHRTGLHSVLIIIVERFGQGVGLPSGFYLAPGLPVRANVVHISLFLAALNRS